MIALQQIRKQSARSSNFTSSYLFSTLSFFSQQNEPLHVNLNKTASRLICITTTATSNEPTVTYIPIHGDISLIRKAFISNQVLNEAGLSPPEIINPADDDDDDFTIQYLSPDSTPNSKLSTMGRIAEIWTGNVKRHPAVDSSSQLSTDYNHDVDIASLDLSPQTKVKNVLAWFKRMKISPQKYDDAVALAQLYQKILEMLSKLSRELLLSHSIIENDVEIESEAKEIWEKMISLASQFHDQKNASLINVESCNAYIQCLSLSNAITNAAVAEELLNRMSGRDLSVYSKVTLPRPNLETYNAVMFLWSTVKDSSGSKGVNRVYSMMENVFLSTSNDCQLRPNIETFKILLASNSTVNRRFSVKSAKEWFVKISEVVEKLEDDLLWPNVDVYNAAMRNNFKPPKRKRGRPSWFDYGDSFTHSVNDSEESISEALSMEEWLVFMERSNIHANVETYDILIQAWVSTGTLEGLLRAESWAKRAIHSIDYSHDLSLIPQLDSFRPILAAWALCGNNHGPERVKEWIDQLSSLSTKIPHLKPDLELLVAQFIAWETVQRAKFNAITKSKRHLTKDTCDRLLVSEIPLNDSTKSRNTIDENIEAINFSAQHCTKMIHELLSDDINFIGLLDAEVCSLLFNSVIVSWGINTRLAVLHQSSDCSRNPHYCVNEMIKIVHLLDDKIEKALEITEVKSHKYDVILQIIGKVYTKTVIQLYRLDNFAFRVGYHSCFFRDKIADVEKMLRFYMFYSRTQYLESTPLKRDDSCKETDVISASLFEHILSGYIRVNSLVDCGHVIRICTLIMDYFSWHGEYHHNGVSNQNNGIINLTGIYKKLVLVVGKSIMHPNERMLAFTVIYNNAAQFFEQNSETNDYVKIDKDKIIEAMRQALGTSDTEIFLNTFHDNPEKSKHNTEGKG